jgi:hypothetical protein
MWEDSENDGLEKYPEVKKAGPFTPSASLFNIILKPF